MTEAAAAETLAGCPVEVWDGPYMYRCSLGTNRCAYHGPFTPAARCTGQRRNGDRCRRPVGHGGKCD